MVCRIAAGSIHIAVRLSINCCFNGCYWPCHKGPRIKLKTQVRVWQERIIASWPGHYVRYDDGLVPQRFRVHHPLLPFRNSYEQSPFNGAGCGYEVSTTQILSASVTSEFGFNNPSHSHKLTPTSPEWSARRPISYARSWSMTTITSSPCPSGWEDTSSGMTLCTPGRSLDIFDAFGTNSSNHLSTHAHRVKHTFSTT